MRKELATAIGCQTPFITHVLSADYHFSPEQGEACARWMRLTEKEIEFFLLLVLHQRASTKALKKNFANQLSRRREQQTLLKKRVAITETLRIEDQLVYYSNWIFAVVHMALLNPLLNTAEALRKRFALSEGQISRALEFLISRGLITKKGDFFQVIKPVLYLDRNSPLIANYHTLWRMRAIDAVRMNPLHDLHYSGVISLSQEDFEMIREKLALLLEQIAKRVKNSKDEKLACLNFDWFEL